MDLRERNETIRRLFVENYYIPQLRKKGYKFSRLKGFKGRCLSKNNLVYVYFNLTEANETSDSYMWCPTYHFISHPNIDVPDFLKRDFHRVPGSQHLVWYRQFLRLLDLDKTLKDIEDKGKELYDTLDLAGVFKKKKQS